MLRRLSKKFWIRTSIIVLAVAIAATAVILILTRNGNEQPNSGIPGYFSNQQIYSGGEKIADANLKSIEVSADGDATAIKMSFAKASGGGALTVVPQYTVSCLDGIPRVAVSFDNLTKFDAATNLKIDAYPLLQGIFKQTPDKGGKSVLYIQTSANIAFNVGESGGTLVIKIKKVKTNIESAYYVVADAFEEYRQGDTDESSGLSPVLCKDLLWPMLISQPFKKSDDATDFQKDIAQMFPGRTVAVIQIKTGDMPVINEAPKGSDGYYAATQRYIGGSLTEDANLKDINVSVSGKVTNIALRFVQGSIKLGGIELPSLTIPNYSVECLDGLNRLVISFPNLDNWDFYRQDNWTSSAFVQGIFRQVPADYGTEVKVYVQLSGQPVYKLSESGDTLTISLMDTGTPSSSGYYVVANAFSEYQSGQLDSDLGLTPALCKDQYSVVMVSQPFDTEADATALKNEVVAKTKISEVTVKQLASNELPDTISSPELEQMKDMTVSDAGHVRPIFAGGRFLAMSPDGVYALFAKPLEQQLDSYAVNEQLWLLNLQSEQKRKLSEIEFSSVENARFSPDGKRIAMIEQSDENRLLTVLVIDTGEVISPVDSTMGNTTTGFTWGADSSTLYAINGDDTLQVKKINLNADDGSRVTSLNQSADGLSSLERVGNVLFFLQSSGDDDTMLVKLDMTSNTLTRICKASSFSISPDGKTAAVVYYAENSDMDVTTELYTVTLGVSSTPKLVSDKLTSQQVFFGTNSLIYYQCASEKSAYPVQINVYNSATGKSRVVLDTVDSGILAGPDANSMMVVLTDQKGNDIITVTFLVTHN